MLHHHGSTFLKQGGIIVGGGIIVIAHRGVALEVILDYVHFPLVFLGFSAQFLGVPSLLLTIMLINTMLFLSRYGGA